MLSRKPNRDYSDPSTMTPNERRLIAHIQAVPQAAHDLFFEWFETVRDAISCYSFDELHTILLYCEWRTNGAIHPFKGRPHMPAWMWQLLMSEPVNVALLS